MVGDNAFEFYNETKLQDYIQIPWDEITYVVADVYFGGKYIPRFEIRTKSNGTFRFSARNSRQTLRAIKARIPRESLRKAPSMGFILKHRFKNYQSFFYVDRDDEGNGSLERLKKDSFYWYKKVIESNGTDLD